MKDYSSDEYDTEINAAGDMSAATTETEKIYKAVIEITSTYCKELDGHEITKDVKFFEDGLEVKKSPDDLKKDVIPSYVIAAYCNFWLKTNMDYIEKQWNEMKGDKNV